ncbi:MAG: aminotransferase class I/II-fold pyridoxal phosphate-dependent enzyme [Bifidobacteriaceae bacterium]|jgi:aminotransferase|nr:aminotransferase class I/II-fold pyridoxal phosphate-dependent enzyme [Bifidobacteriaceae bacterium]
MPQPSARTAGFTDSVIRRMTRVCLETGAVNLSQGFPDFDPPAALIETLKQAAGGTEHHYAITWGAQTFREALAAKQSRFMGIDLDPEQHIVVTCGSTEAMMAAMMTVVDPGDKVVVFSPFYENYGADAILSGAEPVYVPLDPHTDQFDPDQLDKAARGAKAIIVCNPSNPTGKVFTPQELQTIAQVAHRHDLFAITDEVYEHIVFPPHRHTYLATLPGMWDRTLTCGSLSKTYSITGWRLGYVIAPRHLTEITRKVHDFLTVGAPAPLQEAAVTALRFPPAYYQQLLATYNAKRDLLLDGLDRLGITHNTPQGAYYVLVDISGYGYQDDLEFCEDLAAKVGVGAVPGSSFFREPVNHLIRLHFAKRDETLHAALERLADMPTLRR